MTSLKVCSSFLWSNWDDLAQILFLYLWSNWGDLDQIFVLVFMERLV